MVYIFIIFYINFRFVNPILIQERMKKDGKNSMCQEIKKYYKKNKVYECRENQYKKLTPTNKFNHPK